MESIWGQRRCIKEQISLRGQRHLSWEGKIGGQIWRSSHHLDEEGCVKDSQAVCKCPKGGKSLRDVGEWSKASGAEPQTISSKQWNQAEEVDRGQTELISVSAIHHLILVKLSDNLRTISSKRPTAIYTKRFFFLEILHSVYISCFPRCFGYPFFPQLDQNIIDI